MRRFFVLAGPPGAGKTTVLEILSARVTCVAEPARRVLAAQRASGERGTGDQDPALFVDLMLKTAIADFDHARGLTVFDRGLPDLLAFCEHYRLSKRAVLRHVRARRYDPTVFWFAPWRAIYVQDDERTLDFPGTVRFGNRIRAAYRQSGYHLIDVPFGTPQARAAFILDRI
ncbi:MAG: ATP-binding protein [Henriciella sp.]|nr:ATP-binding protein [Henriciella sp.]